VVVDSCHIVLSPSAAAPAAAAVAVAAVVGTLDRAIVQEQERLPRHKMMHLLAAVPFPYQHYYHHHPVVVAVAEQTERLQTAWTEH
jgi:hypothetical protein